MLQKTSEAVLTLLQNNKDSSDALKTNTFILARAFMGYAVYFIRCTKCPECSKMFYGLQENHVSPALFFHNKITPQAPLHTYPFATGYSGALSSPQYSQQRFHRTSGLHGYRWQTSIPPVSRSFIQARQHVGHCFTPGRQMPALSTAGSTHSAEPALAAFPNQLSPRSDV